MAAMVKLCLCEPERVEKVIILLQPAKIACKAANATYMTLDESVMTVDATSTEHICHHRLHNKKSYNASIDLAALSELTKRCQVFYSLGLCNKGFCNITGSYI